MGVITTFSIYNDGIHLIKEHPKEFAEKLYNAAVSGQDHVVNMVPPNGVYEPTRTKTVGLDHFVNLVSIQKPRHADDFTLYAHCGNCVTEVNPYNNFNGSTKFRRKILGKLLDDLNQIINRMSPEDLYNCLIEDTGIIPRNKLPDILHNKIVSEGIKGDANDSIKDYLSRVQ